MPPSRTQSKRAQGGEAVDAIQDLSPYTVVTGALAQPCSFFQREGIRSRLNVRKVMVGDEVGRGRFGIMFLDHWNLEATAEFCDRPYRKEVEC